MVCLSHPTGSVVRYLSRELLFWHGYSISTEAYAYPGERKQRLLIRVHSTPGLRILKYTLIHNE